MRPRQHHRPRSGILPTLALLTTTLFLTPSVAAPHPRDDLHDAGYGYLMPKDCVAFCGYANQYCCSAGQVCYTTMNQAGLAVAGCSTANGGAGFAWYTTTWTETETFTSTISSYFPAATTTAVAGGGSGEECVPPAGSGQIACGPICCASNQYCAARGQCAPNAAGGGGVVGGGSGATTVVITSNGQPQTITTQYSAPYRVTSGTTVTATAGASGTAPAVSASATGNGTLTTGTASHLSGGAIAGIVIGSIAGVALLLLLCFCCIVRGLWHGILALLGLGGGKDRRDSRRTETIIEEERYSRHGSAHARRDAHGGWFAGGRTGGGGRPSSAGARNEKRKSGGTGFLGIGAALGTLLLLLGLRRDNKRKRNEKTRSEVSSSYLSSGYYDTDPSSAGSRGPPRSRDRSSRGTRTTRVSRPPSAVRSPRR